MRVCKEPAGQKQEHELSDALHSHWQYVANTILLLA